MAGLDRQEVMRVILDVLQGPRKGRSFVFDRHDTFIVGRSRFVHCPMPEDSALSRDHFLIEINPPRCELRDLGSTNGTFVNERRVERARLGSGDQIVAGQSVFRVRVEGVPTHVGEVRSPTGSRIGAAALASDGMPITCAGCGMLAPPDLDVASGSGEEIGGVDPVALRPLPRRGRRDPAAGPALHHAPRAGPRGDGGRLPGPAQPDRPHGRAEADRPRDRPPRVRPSTASCARCRSSAS